MKMRFLAFWAINGRLKEDRLTAQLADMKRMGFDGAIFHPRFYPGLPPYMGEEYLRVLSRVILYAKKAGNGILAV